MNERAPFTFLGKSGIYILLPLALIATPTSWIERGPSLCLIRRVFGVRCPGCGMTRAFSCIVHGKFKQAFQYNKLVVIVFPLLCYLWAKSLVADIRSLRG
ncbi:MAG: DUF2752 domain-containing protein [Ktedonobacteraceae bacterium]